MLSNDAAAIAAMAPGAAAQPVDEDLLVSELPHQLYRGDTPLHLAAAGLRCDAAEALLAAGAPSTPSTGGVRRRCTACDPRASSSTWDPDAQRRMIELLVSRGAQVDRPDRDGVTALHRAVRARSPAAVAAVLAAGADPRARTRKAGSTPLHLAVGPTGACGTAGDLQSAIVRMLLSAGASPADVDGNGIAVADRVRSRAVRDALR